MKGVNMTALLDLEPRDAGLLAEPDVEFSTSVDDLHDGIRCAPSICVIGHTELCHPTV
jgi:hypothetical protein